MDCGLGFGDCAVVELDLGWLLLDENALGDFAASGNEDAPRNRGRDTTYGDGNIGSGVAGIVDIDGDHPGP